PTTLCYQNTCENSGAEARTVGAALRGRPSSDSTQHVPSLLKILIDGQTLLTPEINRGIGTYFKSTVEQMLENDFTNEFYLNTPPGPHLEALSTWTRNKLTLLDTNTSKSKHYSDAVNNSIAKLGIDLYWSPN